MARLVRGDLFDPAEVSAFHCMSRCVRRSFLCGDDPYSGRNYDHRKAWLQQRIQFLAGEFGVDILGFAILSNHFHLILRNRPDVVATWSDTEVAARWLRLCPQRKTPAGLPEEPSETELDTIRCRPEKLANIRRRLSDISWLMRMIAEPIARQANKEDNVQGHFWQSRFKSVRLCDEAAVLAAMVYADLNPIRAGLALTPETSDFTSVQRRIESLDKPRNSRVGACTHADSARPDAWANPDRVVRSNDGPRPATECFPPTGERQGLFANVGFRLPRTGRLDGPADGGGQVEHAQPLAADPGAAGHGVKELGAADPRLRPLVSPRGRSTAHAGSTRPLAPLPPWPSRVVGNRLARQH